MTRSFDTRWATFPVAAICAWYFGGVSPWVIALVAVAAAPVVVRW